MLEVLCRLSSSVNCGLDQRYWVYCLPKVKVNGEGWGRFLARILVC